MKDETQYRINDALNLMLRMLLFVMGIIVFLEAESIFLTAVWVFVHMLAMLTKERP